MLDRDTTLWRQGSVISTSDGRELGLHYHDDTCIAVVVTHDCDLPSDHEDFVEIIIGNSCQPNKQFQSSRNSRRLHVTFSKDGSDFTVELNQAHKQKICKVRLSELSPPDSSYILDDDQKRTLKQWLASRYGRPAYPNKFEKRLTQQDTKKNKFEKKIAEVFTDKTHHIIAIFFDLDENRNIELPDGEPYVLKIVIAYDAIEGGVEARISAEQAANELTDLFYARFGTPDVATEIALETCSAIADTELSLADIRKIDQWRLEYISIQDDPPAPYIALGS